MDSKVSLKLLKCTNMSFLMCAKEFYLNIQNNAGLLYKGVMQPCPYIVIHRSGEKRASKPVTTNTGLGTPLMTGNSPDDQLLYL